MICWFVSLLMKDAYLSVMCKNNNEILCVRVVVKWKNGLFHGMCFIFSLLVSLIWLENKFQLQVQYQVEKRLPKFGTLYNDGLCVVKWKDIITLPKSKETQFSFHFLVNKPVRLWVIPIRAMSNKSMKYRLLRYVNMSDDLTGVVYAYQYVIQNVVVQ